MKLFDFLSLKNDVNVALTGSGSTSQRHGSADPDPPLIVMDPQHCMIECIPESDRCHSVVLCSTLRGLCTQRNSNIRLLHPVILTIPFQPKQPLISTPAVLDPMDP